MSKVRVVLYLLIDSPALDSILFLLQDNQTGLSRILFSVENAQIVPLSHRQRTQSLEAALLELTVP